MLSGFNQIVYDQSAKGSSFLRSIGALHNQPAEERFVIAT
jgi:hypothetical protein